MDVYLYNNTKRLNSTALPGTADKTLSCTLKESTSFLSPVLIIYSESKPTANYMKFENRYYWITDIISLNNNRWEIHGTVDVLATFRSHILNTTAFVLYDSTANTQLPDPRLATKTDCDTYTANAAMPWSFSSGTGTYLIATTGSPDEFDWNSGTVTRDYKDGSGVYTIPFNKIEDIGFDISDITSEIHSYLATWSAQIISDFQTITQPTTDPLEFIRNGFQGYLSGIYHIVSYVTKCWNVVIKNLFGGGSALSNVKAAYWLPFVIPGTALSGTKGRLALGSYIETISGLMKVTDPIITSLWIDVSIPWHYNDWRNVTNTEVMLYIPMIGCINIPSQVVKGHNTLQVRIALNIYSGAMSAEVRCDGGAIGTYGAMVGMPYLIGDSNINMGNMSNTIVNAAAENYAGAVMGALNTLGGMPTSVGGVGGGAGTGLTSDIVCICRCHDTSQEPSALIGTIGTPTNQLKTLSTNLGYCQTLKAQLNCTAVGDEPYPTQTEIDAINRALDSGVYLQ